MTKDYGFNPPFKWLTDINTHPLHTITISIYTPPSGLPTQKSSGNGITLSDYTSAFINTPSMHHTENLHHHLGGNDYDEVCWSQVSTR